MPAHSEKKEDAAHFRSGERHLLFLQLNPADLTRYHLGRADTVDNDHIILDVEYETPAAVVAHHTAGLGMVLPYVGHRARPVQVGIHRERLHFCNHIVDVLVGT